MTLAAVGSPARPALARPASHDGESPATAPERPSFRVSTRDWLKPALITGGIAGAIAGGLLLQGAEEFAQAGTTAGLTKPAIALGVLGPALAFGGIAAWIAIANARSRHENG